LLILSYLSRLVGAGNKKPTTVSSRGFLSKLLLHSTSRHGVACYDDYQYNLPNNEIHVRQG
jgi:hypothetical protein